MQCLFPQFVGQLESISAKNLFSSTQVAALLVVATEVRWYVIDAVSFPTVCRPVRVHLHKESLEVV